MSKTITLTVREIADLAGFAGLTLHSRFMPDSDAMDDRVRICSGVKVTGDEGERETFAYAACMDEHPEEGWHGLGNPMAKEGGA